MKVNVLLFPNNPLAYLSVKDEMYSWPRCGPRTDSRRTSDLAPSIQVLEEARQIGIGATKVILRRLLKQKATCRASDN